MQRANVKPADRAPQGGELHHGYAAAARSTVYLNGRTTRPSVRHLRADRRIVSPDEVLPVGAHLITPRRGYTHHGIYVGAGRVVHYAGLVRAHVRGPVEEVSLEEFADGQHVLVKIGAEPLYPADAIAERARSRLGEDRYRITTNNCEHFCEWCLRGEPRSEQVERWLTWPRKFARRVFASLKFAAPRPRRVRVTAS